MRMISETDWEITHHALTRWLSDYERDFGTTGRPSKGTTEGELYDAAVRIKAIGTPVKAATVFDRPILRKGPLIGNAANPETWDGGETR